MWARGVDGLVQFPAADDHAAIRRLVRHLVRENVPVLLRTRPSSSTKEEDSSAWSWETVGGKLGYVMVQESSGIESPTSGSSDSASTAAYPFFVERQPLEEHEAAGAAEEEAPLFVSRDVGGTVARVNMQGRQVVRKMLGPGSSTIEIQIQSQQYK